MFPSLEINPHELAVDKSDQELQEFFGQLCDYLEWSQHDADQVVMLGRRIADQFPSMVEDFYSEILRHAATRQVLRDEQQVVRLKQTLQLWLTQLFGGVYDLGYAKARWQVGRRHVLIGLDQTYATAALGRLRIRINAAASVAFETAPGPLSQALRSINKLMDLESAIINSAYQLSFARMIELSAKQQMQQSERLAAIGQMVTGLAHESRNALQRSHACLETLAMEIEDRPDAVRLVQRVQNALDHLHTLYEEVRNYAAPIKLDRQTVSIPKLIMRCWHQLEHKWKPVNSKLRFEMADGLPSDGQWDSLRMEQVLTNLFQNAIDASGDMGEVYCAVLPGPDLPDQPPADGMPPDRPPRIMIEISDSGPGISIHPPSKIFEPFFTTKTKGTGLGLAISRRAVQAHGGEIDVVPGSKATFRIVLPLVT